MKQITRDKIRLDDKQIDKDLAEKMINTYYFTDGNLKVEFKIYLDHANSKLTITSNNPEFGIEVRYVYKISKELSVIYARFLNQ